MGFTENAESATVETESATVGRAGNTIRAAVGRADRTTIRAAVENGFRFATYSSTMVKVA